MLSRRTVLRWDRVISSYGGVFFGVLTANLFWWFLSVASTNFALAITLMILPAIIIVGSCLWLLDQSFRKRGVELGILRLALIVGVIMAFLTPILDTQLRRTLDIRAKSKEVQIWISSEAALIGLFVMAILVAFSLIRLKLHHQDNIM